MSIVDPFAGYAAAAGAPYAHAIEYGADDIVAGEIELPFVTSCIRIQGTDWQDTPRLMVTLQGGATITLYANVAESFPVRAIRIHQEIEHPDRAPVSTIVMW